MCPPTNAIRRHMTHASTSQLPHSHAQRWLLAYDIRDPRRLGRVGRFMSKEAVRLQYSVYLLAGTRHEVQQVIDQLLTLIDERTDDVRIYALGDNTRVWGLGAQFEDDGNLLCDAVMDKLRQTHEASSYFSG